MTGEGIERERSEEEWNALYHLLQPGESPPAVLATLADGASPTLVWRNELGGQTWCVGDRYLKWTPSSESVDLRREVERLRWLEGRHPAPRVLGSGEDEHGQWMLTAAVAGESAVAERWRSDPERAVVAIAEGLRRLHALPIADVPPHWESWATRSPEGLGPRPDLDGPVVVHGDACSPNTLVDDAGAFVATVDVGDLVAGDRWADLAVASMALEWNYGAGWDGLFFDTYGVEPDPERLRYFRALWDAES